MYTKIIILTSLIATTVGFPIIDGGVSHQLIHLGHPIAVHAVHAAPTVLAYHPTPTIAVKPILKAAEPEPEPEEEESSNYDFEYSVNDPTTGDIKEQKETRKGDVVEGHYTMHEADGTIRTVRYMADKEHGFNAVVEHEGKAMPAPAPVTMKPLMPTVVKAPTMIKAFPTEIKAAPVIKTDPFISYVLAHSLDHF